MRTPILIWGAGAIGGTLGAYWARAGLNVTMVDIVAEHAEACSRQGLAITGPVEEFRQVVPTVTPDKVTGIWPIIVLAVKAPATEAALAALKPHLADDGYVLSAQNGLNEIAIAKTIGAERTMGCFVNFGADWMGPGDILYGNRGAVVVGEIDGITRDRTRQMHAWLSLFDEASVLTDNIWGYLWGKLAYGAMLFATDTPWWSLPRQRRWSRVRAPPRSTRSLRISMLAQTTSESSGSTRRVRERQSGSPARSVTSRRPNSGFGATSPPISPERCPLPVSRNRSAEPWWPTSGSPVRRARRA